MVVCELGWKERFPSDAIVQCHPRCRLPRVLRIKAGIVLFHVCAVRAALSQTAELAQQKVRRSQAGELAGKSKITQSEQRNVRLGAQGCELSAEGKLVSAAAYI